ncbi:3-hydroxybutyrate dehydrogenase [[Mycobacterium] crassicus]|uniref:3-oxoacyl-[acyl-carrier-protein] reductase MabA n=1 Tax=[Mycobacterium] crassicus TaxID=2872309 RepID=A0ABU5XJ01_9MYCO|nr:3-hydroxybutyrate dehydrogenase [Mycolicibacter sp. MYC098]MEB3022104.1 3-hydroxybutyrate dehydrogenase [Mycolicibacter sp. MYC098]
MTSVGAAAGVDLTGRTAVVTGGGSGIGRACAIRLAQAGATVTVVDLDEAAATATAQQIGGTAYAADLTDARVLDELDLTGEIVVNNAGFQHIAPIEEFPPEKFTALLRLMVEAPFRLIQRSLPRMYAAGYGRIVNVSSAHGLRASPFKAGYVAAKHGLEGLSKVTALEGGPKGVTSNCINPGYVRTPLVEKQIAAQAKSRGIPESEVIDQVMLAESAVKRLVEPEEVAELAVYLCSEAAALINGTSLCMDGGWTAR